MTLETEPTMADSPPIAPGVENSRLDACLVLAALGISAAAMGLLAFIPINDKQLPIFAGALVTVLTILTTYAGFRWGSSVTAKRLAGQPQAE
jgi:hypothetical protein